jgi:hypothetical protein
VFVTRKGAEKAEAFLLGVMSSIPFDWASRRLVEGNLTFEVFGDLPIPTQHFESVLGERIIDLASRLAAIDDRYSAWAKKLNIEVGSLIEASQRDSAIAEIDALVAQAYGLNRAQLIYVFESFHRGWDYQPRLDLVLEQFDAWSSKA